MAEMGSNRSEPMGANQLVTCPDLTATTAPPETFGTNCFRCKIHIEYPRRYLNVLMLCPTCRMMFTVTEWPAPPITLASPWPENSQQLNIQSATLSGCSQSDKLDKGLEEGKEAQMRPDDCGSSRGRKVPTRPGARGRRAHSSGNAGTGAASALPAAGINEGSKLRSRNSGGGTRSRKSSQGPQMGTTQGNQKSNCELSQSEIREMLMAKARSDISKKLAELKIGAGTSKSSDPSKVSAE